MLFKYKTIHEAIQNRFILYKYDIHRQPHSQYTPLFIQLNMTSLAIMRKVIDLKFLYNIVNDFFGSPMNRYRSIKLANDDNVQVDLFIFFTLDSFCT